MNIQLLRKLKTFIRNQPIAAVFTAHNGYTKNIQAAFKYIDVIPDWHQKGYVFDKTAPYDAFKMGEM